MADTPKFEVVTGAFGFVGKYIARSLMARGIAVRTLTAHPLRSDAAENKIEVAPFNFDDPGALSDSLCGATTVFNTYWIRFERATTTFDRAVQNTKTLIQAARRAGVRRFVHISITNASADSSLPYFRGKGVIEQFLRDSGLSHAILRPALIFGDEDILINNIAWSLRKFPLFAVPGDGAYRVQPVFVEDLADLALNAAQATGNLEIDAVGPEIYRFDELVRLLARAIGRTPRIVHVNPAIALSAAAVVGWFHRDVMLTRDEISGLSTDLLVSRGPPTAPTRLSDWLALRAHTIGARYASELARR